MVYQGLVCFTSRSRHTRCALVTGVQTCALPISQPPYIAGIGIRPALEGRGAGDEHVGARRDRERGGVGIDAAVDLQPYVAARLVDHLADRLDLAELAGDEALAADAGVDAHDDRSEGRRLGKECVSTGRSGWWPDHAKQKLIKEEE